MIKLFEYFNEQRDFPDVFNNKLKRVSNYDMDKFIDDPSKRSVRIGDYDKPDYIAFCNNFVKVGLQDPTKSIHMFLTNEKYLEAMGRILYKIIPENGANFSFSKIIFGGGLGHSYFYPKIVYDKILSKRYNGIEWYGKEGKELFKTDKEKYLNMVNAYQQKLVNEKVIGNMTYDELVDLCYQKQSPTLHIWTEAPCIHIRQEKF